MLGSNIKNKEILCGDPNIVRNIRNSKICRFCVDSVQSFLRLHCGSASVYLFVGPYEPHQVRDLKFAGAGGSAPPPPGARSLVLELMGGGTSR
jgi:hypothetical protein